VQGDAFAFEAGGMEPGGAGVANDVNPLAVDARAIAGKPSPGKTRLRYYLPKSLNISFLCVAAALPAPC